ncbi:hypothetical protein MFFC18_09390 [Mariniblastus fucicola]|uniref:Uncharacterized protein n=1 Tax=Mariniblastus fucicola TaxID=980251 RepID=A0A5B9P3E7_9BACT|nr:hypothetical protein MFFC18_09390 [Mariniblastus fucicola]
MPELVCHSKELEQVQVLECHSMELEQELVPRNMVQELVLERNRLRYVDPILDL